MKILHVLEATLTGTAKHTLDLAEGQAARGDDVTVIWASLRAEQAFVDRLHSLSAVRSHEMEMHRAIGLHDWRSLRELKAFIEANGPFDVLNGQSSKGGALVRLLPESLGGVRIYTPNAFRTYDPFLSKPAYEVYRAMERVLAWWTDRIIVVSQNEMEHALNLSLPRAKLALAFNGSDPDNRMTREEARRHMGIADDEIAVGFIGRLAHQKDPHRFIEAFRVAQPHCDRLVGVMIGDGDMRDSCHAAASGLRIRFLGWQDGPMLVKGFDFYCMTSLYDACAYTLGEALHAGVPSITTNVGGALDWVQPEKTGVIVAADAKPDQIGREIARLANDDAMRQRWSEQSRLSATDLTLDKMVERIDTIYREAIAEKCGADKVPA
jgi:glycosyltransferase involved in cell wall biosynthesis